MAVIATFESKQVDQKQVLKELENVLLQSRNAELQSNHDMTKGFYEVVIRVPVTDKNRDAVKTLTALSVDAARS